VNNPSIPDIAFPESDFHRLERLARVGAAQGDVHSRFLLSEISRGKVVPDCAARSDSIVTMSSCVTFWIN
jgi:regulator of nucleoside diphosphate kinase